MALVRTAADRKRFERFDFLRKRLHFKPAYEKPRSLVVCSRASFQRRLYFPRRRLLCHAPDEPGLYDGYGVISSWLGSDGQQSASRDKMLAGRPTTYSTSDCRWCWLSSKPIERTHRACIDSGGKQTKD